MIKYMMLIGIVVVAGCASVGNKEYRPRKSREKKAFARVDRSVSLIDVQMDFEKYRDQEVAWVGIIEDIQFKEMERTIQVAFMVEHREFDWLDYGGKAPYRLSAEGSGRFTVGWTVDKPARISYLKTLVKPGDMLVAYGKPYQMRNGVVQMAGTAVRPIKTADFLVEVPEVGTPAETNAVPEVEL